MRRIFLAIAAISMFYSISAQGDAQTYKFDYDEESIDVESVSGTLANFDHFLGERIGKKMYMLQESYTWRDEPDPLKPTPTIIIEKPGIYNNIKKLERYYKKSIKKKLIDKSIATEEFENVLDIALQVRYQETEELESYLKSLKGAEEIAAVFSEKVELSYY
ncbi:MAG: hypothetical protein JXR03_06250 [Cyclobacteriaceae bacterium]